MLTTGHICHREDVLGSYHFLLSDSVAVAGMLAGKCPKVNGKDACATPDRTIGRAIFGLKSHAKSTKPFYQSACKETCRETETEQIRAQ